jgi:hypothetical protein
MAASEHSKIFYQWPSTVAGCGRALKGRVSDAGLGQESHRFLPFRIAEMKRTIIQPYLEK